MLFHRSLCTLALVGFALSPAGAEEAISPDRPDFVNSSDVVGLGRWQLETSIAVERDKSDGLRTRTTTLPTLLRFGVANDWELRFETDGPTRVRGDVEHVSGMSDLSVGVKWHVQDGDEASARPSTGWIFEAALPTGARALRGRGVRPAVNYLAEWDLPNDASIGVMGGAAVDRDSDGRTYGTGVLAISAGRPLAEKLRGFVELAGERLASRRNGGNTVTFDSGVMWRLTTDVQVDTAIAVGVSRAAPDFAWTAGVSVRF